MIENSYGVCLGLQSCRLSGCGDNLTFTDGGRKGDLLLHFLILKTRETDQFGLIHETCYCLLVFVADILDRTLVTECFIQAMLLTGILFNFFNHVGRQSDTASTSLVQQILLKLHPTLCSFRQIDSSQFSR